MLIVALGAFLQTCLVAVAEPIDQDIAIGAIRWDYWHHESPENGVLSRRGAGDRVPFFGRRMVTGEIQVNGDLDHVVAAETVYARAMGVDYFLFGFYPDTGAWGHTPSFSLGINRALTSYLRLPQRSGVKFAVILNQLYPASDADDIARTLAELTTHPDYLRTSADAHPIFILGHDALDLSRFFGSTENARRAFDLIRERVRGATGRNVVLVLMHWDGAAIRETINKYGLDMASSYAQAPPTRGRETPFDQCHAVTRSVWTGARQAKIAFAPNVMLGWDPRPRVEDLRAGGKATTDASWCAPASWAEWERALREAQTEVRRQGDAVPFRSIILYAWNEFTEGGWMAPTWQEGATRMDSLRRAIGRTTTLPQVELRFPDDLTSEVCPLRTTARDRAIVVEQCKVKPHEQFMRWPCPPGMGVISDRVAAPTGLERLHWPGGWTTRICATAP